MTLEEVKAIIEQKAPKKKTRKAPQKESSKKEIKTFTSNCIESILFKTIDQGISVLRMRLEFLKPVGSDLLEKVSNFPEHSLAHTVKFHSLEDGMPTVEQKTLAIFGVQEGRAAGNNEMTGFGLDAIRMGLYQLYPGNWPLQIVDLGDIPQGHTVKDTYFAVKEVIAELVKNEALPHTNRWRSRPHLRQLQSLRSFRASGQLGFCGFKI